MEKHTLIIINPSHKSSYTELGRSLLQALSSYGVTGKIYELDSKKPLHEHFYFINNTEADFYITLDLAGFEMKTDGGRLGYNLISRRMANLLLLPMKSYPSEILNSAMNFSMFFYTARKEELVLYKETYPELPHIIYSSYFSLQQEDSFLNVSATEEFIKELLLTLELQ